MGCSTIHICWALNFSKVIVGSLYLQPCNCAHKRLPLPAAHQGLANRPQQDAVRRQQVMVQDQVGEGRRVEEVSVELISCKPLPCAVSQSSSTLWISAEMLAACSKEGAAGPSEKTPGLAQVPCVASRCSCRCRS